MQKIVAIVIAITCILHSRYSIAQKEINSIHGHATMFVNTDYEPRTFSKLLVMTGSIDKETNEKIRARFEKIGIPTLIAVEIMPPVKEYTNDEVRKICQGNNVDGIVKVEITGQEKSNARTLAQTKYSIEVTLLDLQEKLNAVKFIGTSSSIKRDKAIHDYLWAIMEEFKSILGK